MTLSIIVLLFINSFPLSANILVVAVEVIKLHIKTVLKKVENTPTHNPRISIIISESLFDLQTPSMNLV
jgi:hypothetical protein